MEKQHITVLKCVMNNGAIKKSKLLEVLKAVMSANNSNADDANEATLDDIIKEINKHIGKYDQKLCQINYPLEPEEKAFVVYTWTSEAAVNRLQNYYHESEVHLFFLVIKRLMESDERAIGFIDALNLTSKILSKPISKAKAEKLIEKWIKTGYFMSYNEVIHFGPRVVAEFSHYLKTHFPNSIETCPLCQEPAFWGVNCSLCQVEVHHDCIEKYLKHVDTCPKCKKKWQPKDQ